MPDSTQKKRTFLSRLPVGWFSLTPAATALYLLTLVLALYQLDGQNYQIAKRQIITDNFPELFPNSTEDLNVLARQTLFSPTEGLRQSAKKELERRMRERVAGETSFYEFRLTDPNGRVVCEVLDASKPARFEDWSNTLILRGFSSPVDMRVGDPNRDSAHPQFGRLLARYTTPRNSHQIQELTTRYRAYAVGLALLWAGGYMFLYIRVLRPMRRVTAHLAQSSVDLPKLITRPRVMLEMTYNQMASQALLQTLEERLTAMLRPAEARGEPRAVIVPRVLGQLQDWFGLTRLAAAELSGTRENLSVVESFSGDPETAASSAELMTAFLRYSPEDSAVVQENNADSQPSPNTSVDTEFLVEPDGKFHFLAQLAPESHLIILGRVKNPKKAQRVGPPGWAQARLEAVRGACEVLRRAFLAYRALQQDVFRQKSEANIVLSRNLGHDLTNIIATTKLDLMAVRRMLDAAASVPEPQPLATGMKGDLLRESVRGLLESTRFLQEIVNIYRSFSHVKRPQYERRDLNEVVDEFLRVFEPSVSAKVKITREFGADIPPPIVEPRLLKLALFNVITNALDAHKRVRPNVEGADLGSTPSSAPSIVVRTAYESRTGGYRIDVEDNGPGIRDAEGRLLPSTEVDAIFRHGYSTKAAEASEGLGLSWVRTIIEQFHLGRVRAENLPQGGARVSLGISSMEVAEAKIPK